VPKKRQETHQNHERWLITYADMLTLLLAFFIIMYSISKADVQRFQKFQQGMQQAFHIAVLQGKDAASIQDGSGALVGIDSSTSLGPFSQPVVVQPAAAPTDAPVDGPPAAVATVVPPTPTPSPVLPSLTATSLPTGTIVPTEDAALVQQLRVGLAGVVPAGSEGGVDIEARPEGVAISIYGVLLFDSGVAQLGPRASDILERVAEQLRPLPYDIRVEGNTDSIQPDGGSYPSNWELSAARAVAVTRFLVDVSGLDPTRLSSVGYAEFHPVAANTTRDGRLRNRRVDLVLVRHATLQRG
jgi:chemotaxis protein MotB